MKEMMLITTSQGDVLVVDDVDTGPDDEPPAPDAPIAPQQQQEPRSDGRPSRSHEATRRRYYAPGITGKSYEMQFVSVTESQQASWADDYYRIAVNVMFAQMTAAKGIKRFGERAVAAMFKEYNQLNDMMVFGHIDPDELTAQQKHDALRAVNLIHEKTLRQDEGEDVRRWQTEGIYPKGRSDSSPCIDDIFPIVSRRENSLN
jgi:hypothetical protein